MYIIYNCLINLMFLEFNLNDKIKEDTVKIMNEFKSKYESLDVNHFESFDVGRKACKKFGISADSLMQLCFQVYIV